MGDEIIYSTENVLTFNNDITIIPIEFKQLSDSSVVLQGLMNSYGSFLTNIKFQYGLTENYGDSITGTPNYVYNYATTLVTSTLSHISPLIRYYARITATNGLKSYYSNSFTFMLSPTGLDSLADKCKVVIYPNPAKDYITIFSEERVDEIEIYDSSGKPSIISNNETEINISQLPKGIYFIQVHVGDHLVMKKMVKN